MKMRQNRRQTWNGNSTVRKRKTGLGGWFVVIGNLRLFLRECRECGRPQTDEPLTHYTAGNIDQAQELKMVMNAHDIDTSRRWPTCKKCDLRIWYTEGPITWNITPVAEWN